MFDMSHSREGYIKLPGTMGTVIVNDSDSPQPAERSHINMLLLLCQHVWLHLPDGGFFPSRVWCRSVANCRQSGNGH